MSVRRRLPTRLAVLALLLASCGGVGRDDELPDRSCGAAGPWRPLGPVATCLGSALALPSGLAGVRGGGFCTASPAASCAVDDDCPMPESCRCGLCRVARCTSSDECRAGDACVVALGRCAHPCDPAEPADCPAGGTCSLGGCVSGCRTDDDCAHGESCNARSGNCVAVACGGDADCPSGSRCEVQTMVADLLHADAAVRDGRPFVVAEVRANGRSVLRRFDWPAMLQVVDGDGAPLLEPSAGWEGSRVGAPDVLFEGARVAVFYAGGDDAGIGLAAEDASGMLVRSGDGPVLAPREEWEELRVGAPAAAADGVGGLLLLYAGGDGRGLGAARRLADGSFERMASGPLLVPEDVEAEGRWVGLERLGEPDAAGVTDEGVLRIFFAGRGVVPGEEAGGAAADWSIGLALLEPSADGLRWTVDPFGPVLAERTGLGEESVRDERAPSVVEVGGEWRMIYSEPLVGGGARLRGATCR